jgi:adenylosuccinate synthase
MMKADVLNSFPAIKICTGYQTDNKLLTGFPFDLSDDQIQPDYLEMQGWNTSLDRCTTVSDIPGELAEYIKFIEDEVGLPVDTVSIGPDRLQTLQR